MLGVCHYQDGIFKHIRMVYKFATLLRLVHEVILSLSCDALLCCSICKRCVNLRELRLITDVSGSAMTNLLKEYSHQLAQLQALSISYQAQDELNNGMRYKFCHYSSVIDTSRSCSNVQQMLGIRYSHRSYK